MAALHFPLYLRSINKLCWWKRSPCSSLTSPQWIVATAQDCASYAVHHQTFSVFAVGEKNCLNSWFLVRNVVTFAEWCSNFHCCNLDAKLLLYFLEVRDPWWGHWARLLWSYDWRNLFYSTSLEADGSCTSLFEETLSLLSEYITKLSGASETGSRTPWGTGRIADGIFGYTSVDSFLRGLNILNSGHHTEITFSTVILRHPPNHGHPKRHTTSFYTHPRIEFGSAAHVWCPFIYPGPPP